jgi:hypothetical protein
MKALFTMTARHDPMTRHSAQDIGGPATFGRSASVNRTRSLRKRAGSRRTKRGGLKMNNAQIHAYADQAYTLNREILGRTFVVDWAGVVVP